jgi:hypothetical protein
MALGCINVLSPEFIDLKKQTGLNEHILAAKIKSWQDRNKRELDEFPASADELEITTLDYVPADTAVSIPTAEAKTAKPIKAFRTSKTKDGQKEYDLDKKPKGKPTEIELVIDPSRTLDITQAQEMLKI